MLFVSFLASTHAQIKNLDLPSEVVSQVEKGLLTQDIFGLYNIASQIDSVEQNTLLHYFQNYRNDDLLLFNINNMFQCVYLIFSNSNYSKIRQEAVNLLLDTYRLVEMGYQSWYRNFKREDFDERAKQKLLRILSAEEFSTEEKELYQKYQLHYTKISFRQDTLSVRRYRGANRSDASIQDSLAIVAVTSNLNTINMEKFIRTDIVMVMGWLDMKDAVNKLEKRLASIDKQDYPGIAEIYRLALARLGNKNYEKEILREMDIKTDMNFAYVGYICTKNSLKLLLDGIQLEGNYKQIRSLTNYQGETIEYEYTGDLYTCIYLREIIQKKIIVNFSFNLSLQELNECAYSKDEINQIRNKVQQKTKKLKMNREFIF